ncbi:retrovirus-related pol polyprotein from transposon TNT 1-94 [Tanacetum coccineum]
MKNDNVIAPGVFRINPSKTSREDKFMPINKVRASVRTNLITVSQLHVITKKDVNSDSNGLSSSGVDNTPKTRRPQPKSNPKNDRLPSKSSSCIKNKEVEVKEHPRNLLLFKNKKHMSYECNNVKLAIRNDNSEVVCAIFRFGNDHVAAILGFGDLQWGNILITTVYFIEGLGHNLFLVRQFCDSDLELWHQRLSHLNFDTINDLAKNNLVTGLPKFKYHKEHLCPSCDQGKSKRASYPPKLVPNSKQRFTFFIMDFVWSNENRKHKWKAHAPLHVLQYLHSHGFGSLAPGNHSCSALDSHIHSNVSPASILPLVRLLLVLVVIRSAILLPLVLGKWNSRRVFKLALVPLWLIVVLAFVELLQSRVRWPTMLHLWHLGAHEPLCVSPASILPLVWLLLVLIVIRSTILLPLVLGRW